MSLSIVKGSEKFVCLASDAAEKSCNFLYFVGAPASKKELDSEELRCVKFMLEWLLELKCPFSKIFYGRIKLYYYDQIQGIMALRGYAASDFAVRIVKYTCIQRYLLNRSYWNGCLKPKMLHWYLSIFVPRLVWKQMGKLEYGETEPILRIRSPNTMRITSGASAAASKSGKGGSSEIVGDDLGFNLGDLSSDMITVTPEAQVLLATTAPKKSFTAGGASGTSGGGYSTKFGGAGAAGGKRKWTGGRGGGGAGNWGAKKFKSDDDQGGGRAKVDKEELGFNMGDF
jgi:hypothetical protein